MQLHCQIVRNLSAYWYNDTTRLFQVNHIKHTFKWKFVKVQTVAHIIVGRNRFGVIVNHDWFVTQLACSLYSVYRTPVKFYGRTDAVCTWSQYDYWFFILIVINIVTCSGIGHVQIVGQFRMFRRNGVDALYSRKYVQRLTVCAYCQIFFFHVAGSLQYEACNLEVRET